MPTPTYVSATNMLKGVAEVETGINISGFDQSWSDEKLLIENKAGSPTGFVHNFLVASTCTITGETNAATLSGVLGVAFGTAETIANSIDTAYSVTAGGWYMDDIAISQQRGSLATATINFTKHPDIA
jgi:hypothetical protein